MTEATYKRKDLFGLMVQEGWESLMADNRLERKLRAQVFNCKQETKSKNQKWSGAFSYPSSHKTTHPEAPQTASATRDQVMMGDTSFQPPHAAVQKSP